MKIVQSWPRESVDSYCELGRLGDLATELEIAICEPRTLRLASPPSQPCYLLPCAQLFVNTSDIETGFMRPLLGIWTISLVSDLSGQLSQQENIRPPLSAIYPAPCPDSSLYRAELRYPRCRRRPGLLVHERA